MTSFDLQLGHETFFLSISEIFISITNGLLHLLQR